MKQLRQQRPNGTPVALPSGGALGIRIRTFVLLAGAVRANSLAGQVGRSVLDLPVTSRLRLFDVWSRRFRAFVDAAGRDTAAPEVRVLVGPGNTMPGVPDVDGLGAGNALRVRAERDAGAFRGTAGALRDLCSAYAPDDYVLVGTASQCPDEGQMLHLVNAADTDDGVTLSAGPDGSPTGLMLIRCGALASVPDVGFVDLKQQALPEIARTDGVRVVTEPGPIALPLRELRTYLEVLGAWHEQERLVAADARDPYAERWTPSFSIVEATAAVGEGARLHDAVVLAGAVVEPGCDVVRSVVCPGAVVRRRARVVDRVVRPEASDGKRRWRRS